MANGSYRNVNYGFNQPLNRAAPVAIIAKRAPTTKDINYPLTTIWDFASNNAIYILASVVANVATWVLLETSGGTGAFTTLTSTGATTLATTGASVNTFGNTTGATSVGISVGTGGFTLAGVAGSAVTIGTGITTGAISLGASQTTGTLTIGGSAASGTVSLGNSTGAVTVAIANGSGANATFIGTAGTGSTAIGNTTGKINLIGTVQLGSIGPEILFGSGSPSGTVTAPKGSFYLNTAGSGTTDRAFINTDSGTTWTSLTTAA
jgi:hypothetical protein